VTDSDFLEFLSNDQCFIGTYGMGIENCRKSQDFACLYSLHWSGILVGTYGYPKKRLGYYIGGGKDRFFKATAIEFYGVKTQT